MAVSVTIFMRDGTELTFNTDLKASSIRKNLLESLNDSNFVFVFRDGAVPDLILNREYINKIEVKDVDSSVNNNVDN